MADPAASMLVLEKCAEKCTVTVECGKNQNNEWQAMVARLVCDNEAPQKIKEDFCKCAPTLPIAICLFAKALFSQTK